MKIKMYTKAMCFDFEGTPFEKTMCVVYDSINDINVVDGEDANVSYRWGDTDGDVPLRYPYFMQDPIFFTKKMLGKL